MNSWLPSNIGVAKDRVFDYVESSPKILDRAGHAWLRTPGFAYGRSEVPLVTIGWLVSPVFRPISCMNAKKLRSSIAISSAAVGFRLLLRRRRKPTSPPTPRTTTPKSGNVHRGEVGRVPACTLGSISAGGHAREACAQQVAPQYGGPGGARQGAHCSCRPRCARPYWSRPRLAVALARKRDLSSMAGMAAASMRRSIHEAARRLTKFQKNTGDVPERDKKIALARWLDFKARMESIPRGDPRAMGHDAP